MTNSKIKAPKKPIATYTRGGITIKQRYGAGTKFTARIRFKGKVHWLTLCETADKSFEEAIRQRREIQEGRFSDVKARTALRTESTTTHAELFAVYAEFDGLDRPNEATRIQNMHALRQILRETLGTVDVGQLPISRNTRELLWQWKEVKRAESTVALDAGDEERAKQILRTANARVRQARAVFAETEDLRMFYRMRKIEIPACIEAWKNEPMFGDCAKDEYHAPGDNVIAKTFAALAELILPVTIAPYAAHVTAWQLQTAQIDPQDLNIYKACWLALGFGFRAGDAGKCKNGWFERVNGVLYVRGDKIRKNKRNAMVRVQLGAWEHLAPFVGSDPEAYFLEGTKTERTGSVFRRISSLFRRLGWQTTHHMHELRAFAGCQIAMGPGGLRAAQIFMDHAQQATTERYYGHYLKVQLEEVALTLPTLVAFEPKIMQA